VVTDPLSMLDVIEESRQRAMEQRENAVKLLAAFALKAIIEGEDIKAVAERCGFAAAPEKAQEPVGEYSEMGFMSSMLLGTVRRQPSPHEGFADWVCKALKDRILEALNDAA
jgi:hypothetical protein